MLRVRFVENVMSLYQRYPSLPPKPIRKDAHSQGWIRTLGGRGTSTSLFATASVGRYLQGRFAWWQPETLARCLACLTLHG